MGYVFDYAIDHQNSCSFGAICKGANSILEFDTFCCCCLWWLGFSCIQLPFFLVCWKTYRCSSKIQFVFNCRGLTGVVSRFCDLTEYASCINNGFYKRMFIYCRHFHVNAEGDRWTQKISKIDPVFARHVMSASLLKAQLYTGIPDSSGCPDVGVVCSCCGAPFSVPGAIRCPPGRAPCPAPSFKTSSAGMSLFPPPPSCVAGPLDG